MSVVKDGFAVQVTMGGGITNLLRMARNECRGLVAFVAAEHDGAVEIGTFPPSGGDEMVAGEAVAQLVRLTSSDPEFGHGGPFVRTVILDGYLEPVTVAVAPLGPGGGQGLLGVVGHEPSAFGEHQRRFLERVAERLSRHLEAREAVASRQAPAGPREATSPTPAPPPPAGAPTAPDELRAMARESWRPSRPTGWTSAPTAGAPPTSLAAEPSEVAGRVAPPVRWSVSAPQPQPTAPTWSEPWREAPPPTTEARGADAPAPVPHPGPSVAWEEKDEVTGLGALGSFFSRTGRLVGSSDPAKAVAMVVVEADGFSSPEELVAQLVARTLQAQLRAGDPLVRIGRALFAAAVVLESGSTLGPVIEQRLAGAVRTALNQGSARAAVRSAHVVVEQAQRLEADELLRRALRVLGDT